MLSAPAGAGARSVPPPLTPSALLGPSAWAAPGCRAGLPGGRFRPAGATASGSPLACGPSAVGAARASSAAAPAAPRGAARASSAAAPAAPPRARPLQGVVVAARSPARLASASPARGAPPAVGLPGAAPRARSPPPPSAPAACAGGLASSRASSRRPSASSVSGSLGSLGSSGSVHSWASTSLDEDAGVCALRSICRRIDADASGSISKLEFIAAINQDPEVAALVLPGVDTSSLLSCERSFDAADAAFDAISGGKPRVRYAEFVDHFRRAAPPKGAAGDAKLRGFYDLIDADRSGELSKLELVAAVQQNARVASLLLPGADSQSVMDDEDVFDQVGQVFHEMARGKRRVDFEDFVSYLSQAPRGTPQARPHSSPARASVRVLIVGPGFGQQLNPRQGDMVRRAGYQVLWVHNLPNPEQPGFRAADYVGQLADEIDRFRPDVVAAASKGGAYVVALWRAQEWSGPTVLINAHPSLASLPPAAPVVLAHGSKDETYPRSREELEHLVSTGGENRCLLFYTANSGPLPDGSFTRVGDGHNMETLLQYDCLPRLIDASLCPEGPETHLQRTWRERLGPERIGAEAWLGHTHSQLRRLWTSSGRAGLDDRKLFDVPRGGEEFAQVAAVFRGATAEEPTYRLASQAAWERVRILGVQRVENGPQEEGASRPYCESLRRSLTEQGIEFEPGTHTCWAFHGAAPSAIESICDPVAGFQPLCAGTRNSTLWGSGTYFARDAKYVAEGKFCGDKARDGSRQMLMCLLTIGVPCLGDPRYKGVLPFRKRPHRYTCAVGVDGFPFQSRNFRNAASWCSPPGIFDHLCVTVCDHQLWKS
ncbi:unnamed protein product [Prorocentrum cordatum]|uniref:EF-hand domain-containing protein n=1 Tax=Prorocentrum cordatum TaxID=2364126 RepID=A0ABN9VHD6_9DINO|nr:unnamed protein product [Polarella glacialis]